jgi:hypothetical protein
MKIQIENPSMHISVVSMIVGLCIGGLFFLSTDLCWGLLVGYFGMFAAQAILDSINKPSLPEDLETCAKAALDRFRVEYPGRRIEGVGLRDTNEERLIISVRHGYTMPDFRSYYAVRRSDHAVTKEDRRKWRLHRGAK